MGVETLSLSKLSEITDIATTECETHVFDSDVDIRVKGLVCPSCAIGLKNSFKRHVNVKGLKVDTKKGILSLKYWSVAIPSPEIKKMVKDSGYEVSSIKCK